MAPAGRNAWLTTSAAAPRFRWPLGSFGTVVACAILGCLVLVILLMIYPVLSPQGPAWLVYRFHDGVILPLHGRVFQRYAPVPQIVLLMLSAIAIALLFARGTGVRVYLLAVALWQKKAAGRAVLAAWLGWRREDAPLWAALELDYRRQVDSWLHDPDPACRAQLVENGLHLLKLRWMETDRHHDQARAAIAARVALLSAFAPGPEMQIAPTRLAEILVGGGGLFSSSFVQLQSADGDPEAASSVLDAAWRLAEAAIPPEDDPARDTVLWFAWFAAFSCSDAALAEQIQIRIAATAFDRDRKAIRRKAQDALCFNPALMVLSAERGHRAASPGAALPAAGLTALADRLDRQRDRPEALA